MSRDYPPFRPSWDGTTTHELTRSRFDDATTEDLYGPPDTGRPRTGAIPPPCPRCLKRYGHWDDCAEVQG